MSKISGIPKKGFAWKPVSPESLDLSGKRVLVVGGTGGIGRALSKLIAERGAQVSVVGRTFRDVDTPRINFMKANLELMSEAQRIGQELPVEELDLVIFTTGITAGPKREETVEGIERDLAISFLSRLAILDQIASRLGKNRPNSKGSKPRVFVFGGPGSNMQGNIEDLNSKKSYSSLSAHKNTITGNEALVLYAKQKFPNINFYGLAPGLIKSNIRANLLGGQGNIRQRIVEGLIGMFLSSADTYARRIVPLMFSMDVESASDVFFNSKPIAILPSKFMSLSYANEYIEASEKLLTHALRKVRSR